LTVSPRGSLLDPAASVAPLSAALDRQQFASVLANATVAIIVMDEWQRCVFVNPAAERLTGYTAAEFAGRNMHELIHHTRRDGRPYPRHECPIDRALPRNSREEGEESFIHKDGHFFTAAFTASPMLAPDGKAIGTVVEMRDLAREHKAEDALRDSERRFAATFFQANVAISEVDREGRFLRVNDQTCLMTGRTREELLGLRFTDITHDDHRDEDRAQYQKLWAAEIDAYRIEKRLARPDGKVNWITLTASLVRDESGAPLYGVRIAHDITERKEAEAALAEETRHLETLNRVGAQLAAELDLEKLVQTVTDAGVALSGAEFGAFFYNLINESGESYTLYTLSGVPREAFSKFPMPRNTAVFSPTFRGEGVVRSDDITQDPRYGRNTPYKGMPEGHLPVRSYLAIPVMSRSGDVLGGLFFGHSRPGVFKERAERLLAGIAAQAAIAIDNAHLFKDAQREIAERKQTEARLKLVAAEVDHRARNTLAVIQSITRLSRDEPTKDFKRTLQGRIDALARAHTLLSQSRWQGADVRRLAEEELAPYRSSATRVTVEGPEMLLAPAAAQAISMVLHELATNAAKYGALADARGHLDVTWDVSPEGELRLRWAETGPLPVRVPQQFGFGTKVVERTIRRQLGGEVRFDWRETGLIFELSLPRSTIQKPT
jgi:PAS domain S-box-containing protein